MSNAFDETIFLITKWKEFREGHAPTADMEGFAHWILERPAQNLPAQGHEHFITEIVAEMEEKNHVPDLANRGVIGHLLGRMNLFVKNYVKLPFQNIGLTNIEEFRLLQIIDRTNNLSKSKLSHESLMEFSTVVDVLKRFIAQGLVVQIRDEKDKRASYMQITGKGKVLLNSAYKTLAGLQPAVTGNLTGPEQETLIGLLLKLNHFHTDYFDNQFSKKTKANQSE